jgi:uncharacterized Zn finger protein
MSKAQLRNWWGAAWMEKIQRLAESSRFAAGEAYARAGCVRPIRFDGRIVTAKTQSSHEPPYTVRISVDPFSREEWERLLADVRDHGGLASSLTAGDLPLEIQTAFSRAKLRFIPERYVDLHLECACPDWLKPCKHMVAVWLKFAQDLDREPFLLFELRGLNRDELLALLGKQQLAAAPAPEEFPEEAVSPKPEPLPADPEAFWSAPELPASPGEPTERLPMDDDIFEKLAAWPGLESRFQQIYDSVYELATLIGS